MLFIYVFMYVDIYIYFVFLSMYIYIIHTCNETYCVYIYIYMFAVKIPSFTTHFCSTKAHYIRLHPAVCTSLVGYMSPLIGGCTINNHGPTTVRLL